MPNALIPLGNFRSRFYTVWAESSLLSDAAVEDLDVFRDLAFGLLGA